MVLYFSGTGNSRYAAERIAAVLGDSLVDLNEKIKQGDGKAPPSDGHLVFVTPTYAWRIPRVVEKWIRDAAFDGQNRAWFVMTCGDDNGNAGSYNRKLCLDKGFAYMGTAKLVMPENYIAMFDAPDREEAAEIIRRAEPETDRAAQRIAVGEAFPEPRIGALGRLKSGIVNRLFYAKCVKADAFLVKDACIGCGKCERLCPMNNIRLENGRPLWGGACTHCMACICRCPKEAIEYGTKSVGKPRYTCEQAVGRETR